MRSVLPLCAAIVAEAHKVGLNNAPHLKEFARKYIAAHKQQGGASAPPH